MLRRRRKIGEAKPQLIAQRRTNQRLELSKWIDADARTVLGKPNEGSQARRHQNAVGKGRLIAVQESRGRGAMDEQGGTTCTPA